MGDEKLGRKFPRLSWESLGKDEERNWAKWPCGSWLSYGKLCNRMEEAFEGGLESRTPKKCTGWLLVPVRSSWRIRFGMAGSIRISRAERRC